MELQRLLVRAEGAEAEVAARPPAEELRYRMHACQQCALLLRSVVMLCCLNHCLCCREPSSLCSISAGRR